MRELRQLGFDPVYTDAVFARDDYLAGAAELRARDLMQAWTDPDVAGIIAARGGYGSVQLLPLLDAGVVREQPKVFVGYSDNTSLLIWLMQACGLVSFHGPMIEGRFARGADGLRPRLLPAQRVAGGAGRRDPRRPPRDACGRARRAACWLAAR